MYVFLNTPGFGLQTETCIFVKDHRVIVDYLYGVAISVWCTRMHCWFIRICQSLLNTRKKSNGVDQQSACQVYLCDLFSLSKSTSSQQSWHMTWRGYECVGLVLNWCWDAWRECCFAMCRFKQSKDSMKFLKEGLSALYRQHWTPLWSLVFSTHCFFLKKVHRGIVR